MNTAHTLRPVGTHPDADPSDWQADLVARCTCGATSGRLSHIGSRSKALSWHDDHTRTAAHEDAERLRGEQRDFYIRSGGTCGACGQPGESFCLCTTDCGCHELHPVGSGVGRDAAEVFAETVADQPGLFGGEDG